MSRCDAVDDFGMGRCLLDAHDGQCHAWEDVPGPEGPLQAWQIEARAKQNRRGPLSTDLFGVDHADPQGFGSHESNSGGSDEWLTPPSLIAALGEFDLDPCSPGARRPWDTAKLHYGIEDDGLRQDWHGRVWLNPPYAHSAKWMARLAEHGTGTALLFARTETRMWFDHIWPKATGLLFLRGRLKFHYTNGKQADAAGAPSVLIAYGEADAAVLASEPLPGRYVSLSSEDAAA